MTCPFCTLLSSHSFPHLCLSGTLSLHPNPWDCFWFSAKSNQLGSLIFRTLCNSPAFILFSTFHLENPHFKVRLKCLPLAHSLPGLCLQSLMYPSISTCISSYLPPNPRTENRGSHPSQTPAGIICTPGTPRPQHTSRRSVQGPGLRTNTLTSDLHSSIEGFHSAVRVLTKNLFFILKPI